MYLLLLCIIFLHLYSFSIPYLVLYSRPSLLSQSCYDRIAYYRNSMKMTRALICQPIQTRRSKSNCIPSIFVIFKLYKDKNFVVNRHCNVSQLMTRLFTKYCMGLLPRELEIIFHYNFKVKSRLPLSGHIIKQLLCRITRL